MKYDMFACHSCKSRLALKDGFLACECGRKFPVENGIPVFFGSEEKRKFYETRYGSAYAEHSLNENDIAKTERSLDFVMKDSGQKIGSLLDIGCNPAITRMLAEKTGARAIGINVTSKGMYPEMEWAICDVDVGLPFADGSFDLIFCGDVIEHTLDTDYFISEMSRVMKKGAYLIITTPNIASLWNRIFLMLGYQPHQLGVSERKSYGNPFLKSDRSWGHTKVFTYRALREFLKDSGFTVLKIYGEHIRNKSDNSLKRTLRRTASRLPSISEYMVCICKK